MLFGVLAESAKRALFLSKLELKLLIDLQQSFLVVALQAVNLLVAQLNYHAENMGRLGAEFIPLGALHGFRISSAGIGRDGALWLKGFLSFGILLSFQLRQISHLNSVFNW